MACISRSSFGPKSSLRGRIAVAGVPTAKLTRLGVAWRAVNLRPFWLQLDWKVVENRGSLYHGVLCESSLSRSRRAVLTCRRRASRVGIGAAV